MLVVPLLFAMWDLHVCVTCLYCCLTYPCPHVPDDQVLSGNFSPGISQSIDQMLFAKDASGRTPLLCAASNSELRSLSVLHEYLPDLLNARDIEKSSALHFAVSSGAKHPTTNMSMLKHLAQYLDINRQNMVSGLARCFHQDAGRCQARSMCMCMCPCVDVLFLRVSRDAQCAWFLFHRFFSFPTLAASHHSSLSSFSLLCSAVRLHSSARSGGHQERSRGRIFNGQNESSAPVCHE